MTRDYRYGDLHSLCEHCDGEHQPRRIVEGRTEWLARVDYLRGIVCPECDKSLDGMFAQKATR
jgi:hypothetical protein